MKKIISLITALFLSSTLYLAAQESADVDVDVDVDVVVDANAVQPPVVTTDEIVSIIAQKLEKVKNLNKEQKQKILEYAKQKLENTEISKIPVAVEVCKKIEVEWKNGVNVELAKKEIVKIEKRIKADIEDAQKAIEKVEKRNREKAQKAVEVLQKLVENGIPVEHALNVVKEAVKNKEENIENAIKVRIEEKLKNGEITLPVILPEEIRSKIQERIKEQLELRIQLQQRNQLQLQQQIQQQTQTQSQTQIESPLQIQTQQMTSEEYQQILQQYQQNVTQQGTCEQPKIETESASGGCEQLESGTSDTSNFTKQQLIEEQMLHQYNPGNNSASTKEMSK